MLDNRIKPENRIALWDNMKFVLIFLVVLCHIADWYTGRSHELRMMFFYVYIFHMPAFIFISGLFSKKAVERKDFIRVAEFLILFMILKVLMSLAKSLYYGIPMEIPWLYEERTPWFFFALAAYMPITMLVKRIRPVIVITGSIVLACAAGYVEAINSFLCISRIICFFPFFICGYYMSADMIAGFTRKWYIRLIAAAILIAAAAAVYTGGDALYEFRPLLHCKSPYMELGAVYAKAGALYRLIYYFAAFVMIICLTAVMPMKNTFISTWGSRSIQVYFFHYFAIYACMAVIRSGPESMLIDSAGYMWLVPLALLITVILSLKPWKYVMMPIRLSAYTRRKT